MTFSLIARDPGTGMFGIGITTSSIAVGNRCPWVRAGVGAVTTQSRTDIRLGSRGLDLLESGLSAQQTVDQLVVESEFPERRQLAAIDRNGNVAYYCGPNITTLNSGFAGKNCVSTGNGLDNTEVPRKMVAYFEAASDVPFIARLLGAIDAGIAAGGEYGPVKAAALLVAHEHEWPLVDLRVDYEDEPEKKLRELWNLYEPQVEHYVTQVLRPNEIPASRF
ncbi:DUF1028 domain-containing protein [Chelatococcus asaccharovorans]|uniref:Putative Ntn-hydrolase superfamily protein n=1 Tax=Chelatococcus asaccharovorans TaxID=28210 RepID=A0A2V3U5R4_9HYPH|nr:DUF1028 domain-containing protein [Chelatococcus asaccharovorans]MBS7702059.1 DUF1028 domain-containing protein [Chelatococcus asaccharovorans]PXW52829.1 putative Ntn-hydrolase superfamily protein [Chelatococcus asaccharovorans]